MKKTYRFILLVVALAFIVMQFFQPIKNHSNIGEEHLLMQEEVPNNIEILLKNACLDCHSNNTNYSWFHNIAPVSWMINKHIVEGKAALNFSEWKKYDIFEKIKTLEEICQETERKTMPLKSYTRIHPKAKLSDEQLAKLCEYTTKLSETLLEKAAEE